MPDNDDKNEEAFPLILPVDDPARSRHFAAPERVVQRNRGCWSCKSFENGPLAKQQWHQAKGEVVVAYLSQGKTTLEAEAQLASWDRQVKAGEFGLCMKGTQPGFVHCKYLCDKWDGRQGHSLATSGKKLDKLGDELMDIADSKAKKR